MNKLITISLLIIMALHALPAKELCRCFFDMDLATAILEDDSSGLEKKDDGGQEKAVPVLPQVLTMHIYSSHLKQQKVRPVAADIPGNAYKNVATQPPDTATC